MSIAWRLAWRYLQGRKLRSFLTTLAVALGVMLIFGLNGLLPGMLQALRMTTMAAAGQVDLTITNQAKGPFEIAAVDVVRDVPGVAAASGVLQQNVVLPAGLNPGFPTDPLKTVSSVLLVGIMPDEARTVHIYPLVEGNFLQPGRSGEVLISSRMAEKTGLRLGDTLYLPSTQGKAGFVVVGILSLPPSAGAEEVFVLLEDAQQVLNQAGQINLIEVIFDAAAKPEAVQADILARLGEERFRSGGLELGSELLAALDMGKVAFSLFGLMALAMGGFIIFNTFRTLVAERRRDLGMLRAVGATRQTVVGTIVLESLLQGGVGTLTGLLLGFLLANVMMAMVRPVAQMYLHLDIGWPIFTLSNWLSAILAGMGVTLLAGLVPALSTARLLPLEAIRPVLPAVETMRSARRSVVGAVLIVLAALGLVSGQMQLASVGVLFFLVGLILVAPVLVQPLGRTLGRALSLFFAQEGRLAEGNLARQPGRATVTASALMIAMAIVVALAGVVASVTIGFRNYIERSLSADYLIMPSSLLLSGGNLGAGPELAQELRTLPGIEMVSTLRLASGRVNNADVQVVGIDPMTYGQVSGLEFSKGSSAEAFGALAEGRTAILNGIYAAQSGARVGDDLHILTAEGEQTYRVVGIGSDYLNAKLATIYISQQNLASDFHQTSDVLLMANRRADADAARLQGEVAVLVENYPAFTLIDADSFLENQMMAMNAAMSMMYVLMAALALPGLIAMMNTLAINVIERTRELGMLRAVGSTRRQVRRMILAESLLLALFGTLFGISAGIWLGYVMVGAMNSGGFSMPYVFPLGGVVAAALIGVVFGVLAAGEPARQAANLDVIAALQYD